MVRGDRGDDCTPLTANSNHASRIIIHDSTSRFTLLLGSRRAVQHPVGPWDEILPVRPVGMTAVVLPPGELSIEQTNIHRGHLFDFVIVRATQAFRAE